MTNSSASKEWAAQHFAPEGSRALYLHSGKYFFGTIVRDPILNKGNGVILLDDGVTVEHLSVDVVNSMINAYKICNVTDTFKDSTTPMLNAWYEDATDFAVWTFSDMSAEPPINTQPRAFIGLEVDNLSTPSKLQFFHKKSPDANANSLEDFLYQAPGRNTEDILTYSDMKDARKTYTTDLSKISESPYQIRLRKKMEEQRKEESKKNAVVPVDPMDTAAATVILANENSSEIPLRRQEMGMMCLALVGRICTPKRLRSDIHGQK